MRLLIIMFAIAASSAVGATDPVESNDVEEFLAAVSASDLRLSQVGHSLARANIDLCRQQQPDTGLILHALDSYGQNVRAKLRAKFAITTNVAVEAVAPASPAARAGLRTGDTILAINGVSTPRARDGAPSLASLVALQTTLANLPPSGPIQFDIRRKEEHKLLMVFPVAVCRSRFELRVGSGFEASSDGEMVQIGSRFLADLEDKDLAVLVAHELAHNILGHAPRLAAVRTSAGLMAGFGRNVRYFRQAETQADILSVSLLANAGYAPENASKFWRSVGRRVFGGVFASRSHPSWEDRAATTEAEALKIRQTSQRPHVPAILASRDQPLDGNWQAILVRAPR